MVVEPLCKSGKGALPICRIGWRAVARRRGENLRKSAHLSVSPASLTAVTHVGRDNVQDIHDPSEA